MAVISGKQGKVLLGATALADVTKWSLEVSANVSKWGGSATAGYKKAVGGTLDGSGTIEGKIDTADEIYDKLVPGTAYTLKLYENATLYWNVPCVIEKISIDVDIDDGEALSWSADFQTDGAWSLPA